MSAAPPQPTSLDHKSTANMDTGCAIRQRCRTFSQLQKTPHPVFVRLEKFDHVEGQHRYCLVSLTQTLLGEWCVELTSGPLGYGGGSTRRSYFSSYAEALRLAETSREKQIRRGFVPIPVQLGLL